MTSIDLFKDKNYKPQFSGHNTFPLRLLWLRKAYDQVENYLGDPSVFTSEDAIVRFGVGKNMVASIRHWAFACNIIRKTRTSLKTTQFGKFLFCPKFGVDPYMEYAVTPWILHWMVAGRIPNIATTWFIIFNQYNMHDLSKTILCNHILNLCREIDHWKVPTEKTIKRDVQCFLNCYCPQRTPRTMEESIDNVFAELGLIKNSQDSEKILEKYELQYIWERRERKSLPDGIFLYALTEFWDRYSPNQNTMSVENITYRPGSPGRVFKIDEASITERLVRIEQSSGGYYQWTESAGIRQVSRSTIQRVSKYEFLCDAYNATYTSDRFTETYEPQQQTLFS